MRKWENDIFVADDEVVDQEIEHPVQHHVPTAAGRITKQLFGHQFPKRRIEKIYDAGNIFRKLIHCLSPNDRFYWLLLCG